MSSPQKKAASSSTNDRSGRQMNTAPTPSAFASASASSTARKPPPAGASSVKTAAAVDVAEDQKRPPQQPQQQQPQQQPQKRARFRPEKLSNPVRTTPPAIAIPSITNSLHSADYFRHFLLPSQLARYSGFQRQPPSFDAMNEMLSDDLIGSCFFSGYLSTFEKVQLTHVCKRMNQVSKTTLRALDLHGLSLDIAQIVNLVSRFPLLEALDASYCLDFGRDHLLALSPLAVTLKRLRLKGTNVQDDDVTSFLSLCEESQLGGHPSPLQELDLSAVSKERSTRIGDRTVEAIVRHCPNLGRLSLGWCANVTDEGASQLAKITCLEELDLSLTSVTDATCASLGSLPQLQCLDLSATQVIDCGVEILFNLNKSSLVRELKVAHLPHIDLRALGQAIYSLAPELAYLDIANSGSLPQQGDPTHPTVAIFMEIDKQRKFKLKGCRLPQPATSQN